MAKLEKIWIKNKKGHLCGINACDFDEKLHTKLEIDENGDPILSKSKAKAKTESKPKDDE